MTHDCIRDVHVSLTCEELGKSIAHRCDEEQADILRHMVRAFNDYPQAEIQALYLGKRLFSQASDRDTENVLRFLRMVLSACADDADKIRSIARMPEGQP